MFGQSFEIHDMAVVLLLVVLEGVLSIDNALVLGLLAKRLPKHQQNKALTYGLVGAFVFRFIAVGTAAYLMKWRWVKLLGGGYLVYIAVKHIFFESKEEHDEHLVATPAGGVALVDGHTGLPLTPEASEAELRQRSPVPGVMRAFAKFWPTVLVIELTDIAFAVDSILAAIALAGDRFEKLWVVITGGMLGLMLMRVAAILFIKMLDRFPRFELAAYLLVIVIGAKLLADWHFNAPPPGVDLKSFHGPLDFHSPTSLTFWIFWGLMVASFCVGFIPKKPVAPVTQEANS